MGSNLVIAAIPDENDPVWKVSSEKIPHLTLLFLGDANAVSNLEQIMLFVEHAANTSLKRFSLSVDHRGELGDDKADVLFFKKSRYDFKAIRDFRATLLQDQNIRTAYDSATQFDGPWNPHLTLGYPETPAKPVPDGMISSFYGVDFNKIAVWTGDFEGPDWILKDYWDELDALDIPMDVPMDVAWSGLSHATTVSDTPWSKFKDSDYDDSQYARACLLDRGQDAGTAKQRYGIPVREPDGTLNRNACHAAASVLSSTGGTGTARGNKVKGTPEQIASAKKKLVSLYKSALNEDVPKGLGGEDSVKQTTELGSEFVLEHHGVKGQKWGVRKVEGGGDKAHIRINQKTGRAALSTQSTLAIVVPAVTMPVLVPLAFLSPRVRAEVKASRAVNQGVNADKKWLKQTQSAKKAVEVHNKAADEVNKKLPDFNNDTRWKNSDGTKIHLPANPTKMKEYNTAAEREILNPAYAKAAVAVHGASPTGRYKFEIKDEASALLTVTDTTKVKHAAADDELSVHFKIMRDVNGHISGFTPEEDDTTMAQTADLGLEFLEHHGVKGMRWGQRKVPGGTVRDAAKASAKAHVSVGKAVSKPVSDAAKASAKAHVSVAKAVAKPPKAIVRRVRNVNFEKRAVSGKAQKKVVQEASRDYRKKDLPALKAKPEHQKAAKLKNRLRNPLDPGTRAYRKDARETYIQRLETTANSMKNASGTRQYTIRERGIELPAQGGSLPKRKYGWEISSRAIKHAEGEVVTLVEVVMDDDGFITDTKIVDQPDDSMAQTADLGAEFIEHYGIKGMHWGVRRQGAVTTQAHIDSGILRRQTRIQTKGGEAHPPAHDAITAAVNKQKLKKSGVAALSNKELRDLQTRLQLEIQVKQLTSSKGQKAVTKTLEEEGKQQLSRGVRKAGPSVYKKVRKGAATAATTAVLL